MGLFDYVKLPEQLARRLGRYGSEDYQTKYEVIDGYLRVYNGFDTYRTFWIIDTWIELLIKPKSYDAVSKYPFMDLVKLDELGDVEGIEVTITLYADIHDINAITKLLKDEGFKDPKEYYEDIPDTVDEVLMEIRLNDEIRFSVESIESDKELLGAKLLFKIKSDDYEVSLPSDIIMEVQGRVLRVYLRKFTKRRFKIIEWQRKVIINNVRTSTCVKIEHKDELVRSCRLIIEAKARVGPDISEGTINAINNYVEELARSIINSE